MFRYFSYIMIALFVLPACKVTQESIPGGRSLDELVNTIAQGPTGVSEPSGLSGRRNCFEVYDASGSTSPPWVEEMIPVPGEIHDIFQIVYDAAVYTDALSSNIGPGFFIESESSMRRLSEARSITNTQEQPETPNKKKIPVITWIGFVFSILPVVSVIGVVLSIISIYKIEKYPELYRGENLAGISLLFGLLWALLGVMFLLTFSMPIM